MVPALAETAVLVAVNGGSLGSVLDILVAGRGIVVSGDC